MQSTASLSLKTNGLIMFFTMVFTHDIQNLKRFENLRPGKRLSCLLAINVVTFLCFKSSILDHTGQQFVFMKAFPIRCDFGKHYISPRKKQNP